MSNSNSNSTGLNQAELWQHYLTQNPHWQEDGARLTAAGLKKLFEQTVEALGLLALVQ